MEAEKRFCFFRGNDPIIELIKEAENFLNLISFQLTSEEIVEALIEARRRNVTVTAIALPADSYKATGDREKVEKLYAALRSAGVKLFVCSWEVGEPSLTPTSLSGEIRAGGGGKWYSLHCKLLMSERCALITSCNFTDEELLECYLRILNPSALENLNKKFVLLKELFVDPVGEGLSGRIFERLPPHLREEARRLLQREDRLNVREYPPSLSPRGGLCSSAQICPFEGRARDVLLEMIRSANEFLYLSTERLFDDEIVEVLVRRLQTGKLIVKLMSGPPQGVRQNPAKAASMVARILACGGEFASPSNIHAKLWLTEDWLVIGSPNITKMNLGFKRPRNFWRGNTEILYIEQDPKLLSEVKQEFERVFVSSLSGAAILADISSKRQQAKSALRAFGLKCEEDAVTLMARLDIELSLAAMSKSTEIARLATGIARRQRLRIVNCGHVAMAAILVLLKERRHQERELRNKLTRVLSEDKIKIALEVLHSLGLIEETTEGWAIDLDALIGVSSYEDMGKLLF